MATLRSRPRRAARTAPSVDAARVEALLRQIVADGGRWRRWVDGRPQDHPAFVELAGLVDVSRSRSLTFTERLTAADVGRVVAELQQ